MYKYIDENTNKINAFLNDNAIPSNDIPVSTPSNIDKSDQQWSSGDGAEFRYSATQTVTVYSEHVAQVRSVMSELSALGKQGRSEEHTSELQSRGQLVCRLLLEKKNHAASHRLSDA